MQEALRNGHQAFKAARLGGPVSYEQIPALAERGKRRAEIYFNKLETRLGESEFIAGDRYTYADIVGYVYLGFAARALGGAPPLEGRPRCRHGTTRLLRGPRSSARPSRRHSRRERAPGHDQRLAVVARDERLDAVVRADRRRAQRRFRRPVADDCAVVHEQHAVAEARREAEIVQHRDDQARLASAAVPPAA